MDLKVIFYAVVAKKNCACFQYFLFQIMFNTFQEMGKSAFSADEMWKGYKLRL